MIRFIGVAFIFMASAYVGINLSENIRRKKERFILIRKILAEISELIRWNSLTMSEIIVKLTENNEFCKQEFIRLLPDKLLETHSFPEAWERAIRSDKTLSDDEKKLLFEVGATLGTTDIDGQLSSLEFYISQADKMAEEENEIYKVKGKMYRSLGVAFGAMIGILII